MSALRRHFIVAILVVLSSRGSGEELKGSERLAPPSAELNKQAMDELRHALREQSGKAKGHAAEALLALSYRDEVHSTFDTELANQEDEPFVRVHVWRVLAQASTRQSQREQYLGLLWKVCKDPTNPDSIGATEALAILRWKIPDQDRLRLTTMANDSSLAAASIRWLLAASGDEQAVRHLSELLGIPKGNVRQKTARALQHISEKLPADVIAQLVKVAASDLVSSPDIQLIAAAFVAAPSTELGQQFKEVLLSYASSRNRDERCTVATALAKCGTSADLSLLAKLLKDDDADVRVSAANAILRIDRRKALPFELIDWVVLCGYGLCMLAIGWYFSRRTRSTEGYLLADRNMGPWAVGLSYFATLFSTISYLAYPGEMIRNGPMIISGMLAYPLIFVVVAHWLIPYIMRLRVTSAYEILEMRFGLSVRMLGSAIFMALRLSWMSFIIFATSKHVLVPLLRLDNSATAWVAIGLGALTVTYTSMGGLRAVIWTDVAQMLILLCGAIVSIVMISIKLGGPAAWLPNTWNSSWESPKFWFDPTARVTLASAMLSSFVWYVCTAGSDQMAVQRYLATRDARTAKRMYGISLGCDAIVLSLLAMLGLALFAYFRAHPQMLPDGYTIENGADRLLPQYIVKGLPAGVSGLIVAGLLAAAMSSLSSGLSSACSVITVDWIDRFRKSKLSEGSHFYLVRSVSWLVGAVVVILSFVAGFVQGNLLEAASKLTSLLTAPLFVLFFLAMFVPWATTAGTWAAGLSSILTAILIAHTKLVALSFLWIMPMSLLVGISVGCVFSLLLGKRRPILDVDQCQLIAADRKESPGPQL